MENYETEPELNITPLVDIMLVLLAILMVTTPVMYYEENITLPNGSKQTTIEKKIDFNISITKNKTIKMFDKQFVFKDFENSFKVAASKVDRENIVYIFADKSLPYGDVMTILKIVKLNGFTKVSLVTDG